MHRLSLLILTLVPLAFSQTFQTRISCLSDGQCLTDLGENAVCGKLDSSSQAKLPVVEGSGENYMIRIDLSAPLPDDPNPQTEKRCTECPTNVSGGCKGNKRECEIDPNLFTRNDPRSPTLGGVGCETPAFRRRCNLCCVQTDILLGTRFTDARRKPRKNKRNDICEIDKRCEDQEVDDEEALRLARGSSRENCFRRAPLGFYRTPRPRFFRRCTRLSQNICGDGLRLCRDFS